jgi:hypothetical protein
MKPITRFLTALIILSLGMLTACNLPFAAPKRPSKNSEKPTPTPMPTLMATPDKHHPGILMTLAAHKTAQAANQPAQSGAAAPTDTPSTPTVTVSSPTNCRAGPSTDYDLLYTLNVGETAEVVGKYSGGNYWVINNPDGGGNCWLWGEYATISGDTDNLPEMIPPPAPPTDVAKVHPKKPTPTDTPVPTHAPMFILPFFLIPSPTPTLNHNIFRPYVPIWP